MELLTEKYRPKVLDDLVVDESVYLKLNDFINSNEIPHLLFHGRPGVGKTSISKVIVDSIDCDHLYINASDENNIDTFRNKVKNFVVSMGFRKWKVVILDESDNLSFGSMAILRNFMEEFSNHSRFILTCNYIEKVIEPIQSRCQLIKLEPSSKEKIGDRIKNILNQEGIKFNETDIQLLVEKNYPDMRRMLNDIDYMTREGVFEFDPTQKSYQSIDEPLVNILQSDFSKGKKLEKIRTLIKTHSNHDFHHLFQYLFKNVDKFSKRKVGYIITLLGDGEHQLSLSFNKELIFVSTITKIINSLD